MTHGAKWNTIALNFENRSDLSLRNRWHQIERRIAKTGETMPLKVTSPEPEHKIEPEIVPFSAPAEPAAPVEELARPISPFNLTDIFDVHFDTFNESFDPWSLFY
jgi:hypothetical protein